MKSLDALKELRRLLEECCRAGIINNDIISWKMEDDFNIIERDLKRLQHLDTFMLTKKKIKNYLKSLSKKTIEGGKK